MKIIGINYNWVGLQDGGEKFVNRTVGIRYGELTVVRIHEHPAMGEGDKWHYDIHYSDGSMERIFNPNESFFAKDETL